LQESVVRIFRVTFLKEICDDTGHDVQTSQGVFDVNAEDARAAAKAAKRRFCHERHIRHWSVNADKYLVELLTVGKAHNGDDRDKSVKALLF
jgi:hypothetical protein